MYTTIHNNRRVQPQKQNRVLICPRSENTHTIFIIKSNAIQTFFACNVMLKKGIRAWDRFCLVCSCGCVFEWAYMFVEVFWLSPSFRLFVWSWFSNIQVFGYCQGSFIQGESTLSVFSDDAFFSTWRTTSRLWECCSEHDCRCSWTCSSRGEWERPQNRPLVVDCYLAMMMMAGSVHSLLNHLDPLVVGRSPAHWIGPSSSTVRICWSSNERVMVVPGGRHCNRGCSRCFPWVHYCHRPARRRRRRKMVTIEVTSIGCCCHRHCACRARPNTSGHTVDTFCLWTILMVNDHFLFYTFPLPLASTHPHNAPFWFL